MSNKINNYYKTYINEFLKNDEKERVLFFRVKIHIIEC